MATPRELLEEFRAVLRQPTTLTTRRNAVRTFHDFLKVLLKQLARPEEELFLGHVDLKKRFVFVAIHYPEMSQFEGVVFECKSERDRVDHSDSEAPPMSVLERWNEKAQALSETVERCQKHARQESVESRLVLMGEFEEVERLVDSLSGGLRMRGLSSEEIEVVINQFRGLYKPYYDWNDAKIHSATDYEVASAIASMARRNGLFGAKLDTIADILASQFALKNETAN